MKSEKQKLEEALASLNISDETLAECLEQRKQEKINPEKKVDPVWLPLATVYIKGPDIIISSYLDLTRKDYLWGIIVSDICICKKCAKGVSMQGALRIHNTPLLGNRKARIPDLSKMIEILSYKKEIQMTVKILKRYGIEADDFGDDWHWAFFSNERLGLCKQNLTLQPYPQKCTGNVRCYFKVF